jgi:hypothetical protein
VSDRGHLDEAEIILLAVGALGLLERGADVRARLRRLGKLQGICTSRVGDDVREGDRAGCWELEEKGGRRTLQST